MFRMVSSILEVLESSFTLSSTDETKASLKQTAVEVASNLLTLPTPPPVQIHTTALLAALHNTKSNYHGHKVKLKNNTKFSHKYFLNAISKSIFMISDYLGSSSVNTCT